MILPYQVISPTSPNPIVVDLPNFSVDGTLRAAASNSCGEVSVKTAGYDCDCNSDEGPKTVGGPVRLWDGSMTYSESDPLPSDAASIFSRNYDTLYTSDGLFGTGWRSAFNAGLVRFTYASADSVSIQTENERRASFRKVGGSWVQTWPAGIRSTGTLQQQGDGSWLYGEGNSHLFRIYRADGRFGGFDDRGSGRKIVIDYNTSGVPERVYAADGTWSCSIIVTGNHITSISVDGRPDLVWQYGYSGSRLVSITLTGSAAWRTYEYSGGLLSAVRDAAGNLIESHTYDAQGRATSSVGSANDITGIEYNLGASLPDSTITRVTYATGEQTTFEQRFIQGRQQTISTVGGCGSCGSRNSTHAFEESTGRILRSQDARGYIKSFAYDGAGKVILERSGDRPANCDPEQDASHCRLSAAYLLAATLQATAASTFVSYAYGDLHWPSRPTIITAPSVANPGASRVETIVYDANIDTPLTATINGWSSSSATLTQSTFATLYDGTLVAAFDPGRNFASSWLTLPQPMGRRRTIDGPRTDVSDLTTFVYYPVDSTVPATNRGRIAATKNAAGHITTFENYDVFGNAARVVDPNGVATESTYDALGRVLTTTLKGVPGCDTVVDPLCTTDLVTSRTYTPATGPLTSQTDANGNVTTYEYDTRGRMSAMSRGPAANAQKERAEYTYDAATGHKSMERYLAMENGSWIEKHRESFSYDPLAQLSAQTHADATSIAYTYDESGSTATVRDENHALANTRYAYDPVRRLSSVRQTLGAIEITTSYAYDDAGNLTSVTDPNGNVTTYAYDDLGRMISQTSPVTGTTAYSYDVAGNLTSTTDANNAVTTRTYDVLGRALTSTATAGASSEPVAWTYDGGTFGLGRLSQTSDPAGMVSYAYDRRGLLLTESRSNGAVLLASSYRYDAAGNRTFLNHPAGVNSYTYDYAGRPLTLSSGVTYVSGATYLPFGPLLSLSFANGTTQTRGYDARYRIQRNTLTGPAGVIADYSYTEDSAGNITSIHDVLDATFNRDFGYDDLNRLVTAASGGSLWGSGGAYTYDSMGNLLARDLGGTVEVDPNDPLSRRGAFTARPDALPAPGSVRETYGYTGTTSLLSIVTSGGIDHPITYDPAGNEVRYYDTRNYSPRNLMTSITEPAEDSFAHTINYTYDGRGVRVIRSEGTTGTAPFANRYYVYSPELHLLTVSEDDAFNVWGKTAVMNIVPSMKHVYAWFGDHPTLHALAGNTLRYIFTDHLGTPLLETDGTATVVWRAEYEPYGDIWTMRAGTAADQLLRFPGQEYAGKWEGTEERYNIFRWYRAGWGRYTQADPLEWAGLEFAYTSDNPIRNTDALGLFDTGSAAKDLVRNAMNACGEKAESAWGGPLVGALLLLIQSGGDLNPEEFENRIKKCNKCETRKCRPCVPPVGTRAYREDTKPSSPPHRGVPTPHWHLYEMHQSPPDRGCVCFWHPIPDNQGGFGASPPPPATVPITPAAGGGIW